MADRKAEIERRKKRLEELRQAREVKKKEVKDKELLTKPSDPLAQERENVDELLTSILGPSSSPVPLASAGSPARASSHSPVPPPVKAPVTSDTAPARQVTKRKPVKLVVDQLLPINIKPRLVEVYAKETQTELRVEEQAGDSEEEREDFMSPKPVKVDEQGPPQQTVATKETEAVPVISVDTLSEEQIEQIMASEEFGVFMDQSSRVMERALADSSDILFDRLMEHEEQGEGVALGSLNVEKKKTFSDERWTRGKMVSSIDWSPHHSGVLLASYCSHESVGSDPDGVVLVWDLKFSKDTPDYIFNCHSPVMSAMFSRFHPQYIIGGTYSGQVVLWDTRIGRRTPVQRSPLASSAHTHPIYCLSLVGSPNAHNLISISNDGKMCSWNLDNISQPQDSLELQSRQPRPVAATCLSFPLNDVNKFVVGSEECLTYQGQRHGKKPGVVLQYEGHSGPVSGISCHRAPPSQGDLSHLFLTASFDWTVKLWSTKLQNENQINSKTVQPLCSFETSSDYVYDVEWSPIHPALFAVVDGDGKLDFWNLNHDLEVPILSETLERAVTKVKWAPTGQQLACGDCDGGLHVFEAGEGLCTPAPDDWTKLQETLLELQTTPTPPV